MRINSLRSVAAAIAATALFLPKLSAQYVDGEVVVPAGSEWEYLLYAPEPTFIPSDPTAADADFYATWYLGEAGGYDGPAFSSGPAALGYGDVTGDPFLTNIWEMRDGLTEPPDFARYTAYFRTTFTPTEAVEFVRVSSIIDDGAVIYINGVELTRTLSMLADAADPQSAPLPDVWNQLTSDTGDEAAVVSGDFPVNLPAGVPAVIGVSLHSAAVDSSDLGMNVEVVALISPDPSPPDNDDWFTAEVIDSSALPETVTGRTHDATAPVAEQGLGATLEVGEPQHAGVANVGSIWYSFQPLESGRFQASVGASDFPAVLAVYTGDNLGTLSPVASATDNVRFYRGATVFFDGSSAETYYIAVCGEGNGGAPVSGENFGNVTLRLEEAPDSLFTEISTLLPAGSNWSYLLAAEDDPDDPLLTNQPVDPALLGAGDPDFHTTWHTAASYNGPAFSAPAPALLGYGLINADPILTDTWGGRDIDADPATEDTAPPTGLRYASYFRTSFTPAAPVAHLGFRGLIDDGAVIFINGVEVSRINFFGEDPADWQAFALDAVATEDAPQEGVAANVNLPAGVPVEIGVTLRNPNATSSDSGFDLAVYSIEQPVIDFGTDLANSDPLRARFDSANPGDVSGLGDGGSDDNLPWESSLGVSDESALPNSPNGSGNTLYVNNGGFTVRSGSVDVRNVDRAMVTATFDLRTYDTSSGFEGTATNNDNVDAYIEGSEDGILFARIVDIVTLVGEGTDAGILDGLENPDGSYTSYGSNARAIGNNVNFIRIVVSAANTSDSEHFYVDNLAIGTSIGPPPPFVATITRNQLTGENRIEWNVDGVSLYEVYYGDLTNWDYLDSDVNLSSFLHTPPPGDTRGYYQIRRLDD